MSQGYPLRLDEADKTPEQIAQREATYQACKILKAAGINAEVREFWTGKYTDADAAGIFIRSLP